MPFRAAFSQIGDCGIGCGEEEVGILAATTIFHESTT